MKKSIIRALVLGLALAIPAGYAMADSTPAQGAAVTKDAPTKAKPAKKGKKGGKKKKKGGDAPPPATP